MNEIPPNRSIEKQPESEKLAVLKLEVEKLQAEEENENIDDRTLSDFLREFRDDISQLRAISDIETQGIKEGSTFTVDFKNNEALEMDITAAIFPAEIREITVSDPEQGVIKGKRQGLKGEFYAENGQRLKIYTESKVTIDRVDSTAVSNLVSDMKAKMKNAEGTPEFEIEKYALEHGLDPEFLLSVRDEDGSFSTLLSIRDRYGEIPPEQQLRMAAVVIGRMQSEFTERNRNRLSEEKIKDASGKYTPQFMGFILRKTWLPKLGEAKTREKAVGYLGEEQAEVAKNEIQTILEPTQAAAAEAIRSKLNFEQSRFDVLAEPVKQMMAALAGEFPDVRFTSGIRSVTHNKRVGGKENSDHLYGLAFDAISVPNNRTRLGEMQRFINNQFGGNVYTLVHNPLHLHVSYRPNGRKLAGLPTVNNYGATELREFKQRVDRRLAA